MDRNLMFFSPYNNLNLVENLDSQIMMSPELHSDSSYRCEDGGGDASASLVGEEENPASCSAPAEGQMKMIVDMGRNVSVVNPVMHTPSEGAVSMVSRSFGRMPYLSVGQHATCSCPFIRIGHEEYVLQPDTIFVLGMRQSITKNDIIVCFGQIGQIKVDEGTHKPKIFVYKDKLTGRSKGEATITFVSPLCAQAAITAMSGRRFMGHTLTVLPAYLSTRWGTVRYSYPRNRAMEQQQQETRSRKWKPAIDNWSCLVCRNSNFVWRSSCNRCLADKGTAPTSGILGNFSRRRPHSNDWLCDGCNNINFWYRKRCNLCNSSKQKTEMNGETDTHSMEKEKWDLVLQSSAENLLSAHDIPMEV
ncbi:transcription initiation factor TFIID subunit 15 [Drosophila guanche]|uniref:Blast:Transcription initiation factor TFIID subunit 15 n=1 Tax=Drosophila guanche TaxID=7266 RepID=A0A3B0K2B2_DROGU|nr:transcription initiation factor TFIID subunit 15 [Drosophila guanche]SPP88435.1 blast:Transcription initiation factor TFIID subunit 15 [Drosophila guanche]